MQATLEARDGSVIETVQGDEETIRARAAAVDAYCLSWVEETDSERSADSGYLPEWLDPGEDLFVKEDSWRLLYALGVNCGWPESWQRGLLEILETPLEGKWERAEADVQACVMLLNYRGIHKRTGKPLTSRSAEIKHSLKAQLVEWLEGERKFGSPFSPRQWARCMRTKWNAYGTLRERGQRIAYYIRQMLEAGEIWPERVGDLVPCYTEL